VGASSAVSGSGGDFSALLRSGHVAVVGGVSVGVVGLLASVLARSAGLSAAMDPQVDLPSSDAAVLLETYITHM
jgi:hypothetical protein